MIRAELGNETIPKYVLTSCKEYWAKSRLIYRPYNLPEHSTHRQSEVLDVHIACFRSTKYSSLRHLKYMAQNQPSSSSE
ncbi:hypothetical protein IF2G_05016 [Cordyceps javanica]|nr:hypothetical protein IF2G_05016 [Cordyceps javanica]